MANNEPFSSFQSRWGAPFAGLLVVLVAGCASDVQVRTTPMKDAQVDPTYQPVQGGGANRGSAGTFDKTIAGATSQHEHGTSVVVQPYGMNR